MNKTEMDAAIKAEWAKDQVRSLSVIGFLAGLRAAAEIAEGEHLIEGLGDPTDEAYNSAIIQVAHEIRAAADELGKP